MRPIIKLENISKTYTYAQPFIESLFNKPKKLQALKDISLSVKEGEMVGIIGENGAGKSTLLNIVAGITEPTSGNVTVRGKVVPLIDLNAGFHPELSGKENIFINGLLLGMSKKEIKKKYDQIVKFSELEDFINHPIFTYSDGMKLRLGFSIAINSDPNIVVIDEVMAVGDFRFRMKCYTQIKKLRFKKKTFLFVTHAEEIINYYNPEKIIWLHQGKIKGVGPSEKILPQYNLFFSNKEIS